MEKSVMTLIISQTLHSFSMYFIYDFIIRIFLTSYVTLPSGETGMHPGIINVLIQNNVNTFYLIEKQFFCSADLVPQIVFCLFDLIFQIIQSLVNRC